MIVAVLVTLSISAILYVALAPRLQTRARIRRRMAVVSGGTVGGTSGLFGQRAPEGQVGESLLPLMRLDAARPSRRVFAEGRLRRASYPGGGLKVIEDTVRKVTEVYDLRTDPGS